LKNFELVSLNDKDFSKFLKQFKVKI